MPVDFRLLDRIIDFKISYISRLGIAVRLIFIAFIRDFSKSLFYQIPIFKFIYCIGYPN